MKTTDHMHWNGTRPALVTGMSNDSYQDMPEVSASDLKAVLRSPAHYMHRKRNEPTRAMTIGTAIHTALLEPERFGQDYINAGTKDRRASEYKQAVQATGTDELVLTQAEYDKVMSMQHAALSHSVAGDLLGRAGDRELSVFATDDQTGLGIKCRPDLMTDDGVMIDVKKTQDARADAFGPACARYEYDLSAAHYMHTWNAATGQGPDKYMLIAIEEEPPHGIGVYEMPKDWLDYGLHKREVALDMMANCLEENYWPGYEEAVTTLMPPRWLETEIENQLSEQIT